MLFAGMYRAKAADELAYFTSLQRADGPQGSTLSQSWPEQLEFISQQFGGVLLLKAQVSRLFDEHLRTEYLSSSMP